MVTCALCVIVCAGLAAPAERRELDQCILIAEAEGQISVRHAYVPQPGPSRGQGPTRGQYRFFGPPFFRLPPIAGMFLGPYVSRVDARRFVIFHAIYEGVSTRVVHAEALTPEWLSAWEDLGSALGEIVDTSLTAPGEEKRRLLTAAIEKGSRALGRMTAAPASTIDAAPRNTAAFRRTAARQWGRKLREYAAILRIEPAMPFPPADREPKLHELLAESPSGAAFAERARELWGEAALEEDVLGAYPLGRNVHGWEFAQLPEGEFEKAREAARKETALQKRAAEERAGGAPRPIELPAWGVEVSVAGADVLAQNLALSGVVVSKELAGGPKLGLRAGDFIFDVTPTLLEERSESGGTAGPLRVVRGGALITISAPGRLETVALGPCFLRREGDFVWTEEMHVYLGMFGQRAYPPRYRLGPELERALTPVIARVKDERADPFPAWWQLPRVEGPIVLLLFDAGIRLADMVGTRQRIYEVESANIRSAEFVTPEWVKAFEELDGALRESVRASCEMAPGAEKRARLVAAIGRGAAALQAMARERETADMRAALARIAAVARVVHTFERRIAGEWGGCLRRCAKALGLEPGAAIPFPPEPPPGPGPELLAASTSPAEFVAKVRERCGEDGLEDRVTFSNALNRVVWAWEFEDMPLDRFEEVREAARKGVEERKEWEARQKADLAEPAAWEVPEWRVRLRAAGEAERARALVVRGTIVEQVLGAEGSPIGLERGDIIIDYGTVYDIVMGGTEFGSPRRSIEGARAGGRALAVIRGDRLVPIAVPPKQP